MFLENVWNLELILFGRQITYKSIKAFLRFRFQLTPFKVTFFALQIHSFTEVVQKVQISNVDLDTHTEVCRKILSLYCSPIAEHF